MAPETSARARMVDAAVELFHRQGVNGTSVDQVLAKSRTGKSQFTHYFKTKDGLVSAAVARLREAVSGGRAASRYELRTWADLDSWFGRYIGFLNEVGCDRSCPIGTIGGDLTESQHDLRGEVCDFLQWARAELARFFKERKKAGELKASADPDALADLCIAVMEGGMLLSKITRSTASFERAAGQARAYVRSLRRLA